jgi:hypothetical protein
MAVHVVYVRPMQVANNQIVDKSDATISQMTQASMEIRVIPDGDVASSANSPSIKDYLVAEDAAGFALAHMDNTMIVTKQ